MKCTHEWASQQTYPCLVYDIMDRQVVPTLAIEYNLSPGTGASVKTFLTRVSANPHATKYRSSVGMFYTTPESAQAEIDAEIQDEKDNPPYEDLKAENARLKHVLAMWPRQLICIIGSERAAVTQAKLFAKENGDVAYFHGMIRAQQRIARGVANLLENENMKKVFIYGCGMLPKDLENLD